ncbi:MAG: TlpA disulfide reductase family protein [Pseudomonadota bacterium]
MKKPLIALMAVLSLGGVYALASAGANAQAAPSFEGLLEGDMVKLRLEEAPAPLPATAFTTLDGVAGDLTDYQGKVVLLNFWATWCAPCRVEMPHLEAVNQALGGDDFAVVTLATGRNNPSAIKAFFSEIGVETLPDYVDPQSAVARGAEVRGLPVTLLMDREGNVLGRVEGIADWNAPEARAVIQAAIDG